MIDWKIKDYDGYFDQTAGDEEEELDENQKKLNLERIINTGEIVVGNKNKVLKYYDKLIGIQGMHGKSRIIHIPHKYYKEAC